MKLRELSDQDGWYKPDLGPTVPLPDSFLVTINNMEDACLKADKYAQELAEATIKEIEKKDLIL
jgi:hypothetical protein